MKLITKNKSMIIYILDLFGVAVFAVTGVLAAGRKRMDVFGAVVVAIVTAIGGGTLRDLILGIKPILWVEKPIYVVVAAVVALITFAVVQNFHLAWKALLVFDAFGLAMFTVIGCERAAQVHVSPVIIVVMGVITGVAGGIIRDILCAEVPLVLRREVYATASLAGGILYVGLRALGIRGDLVVVLVLATVLAIRVIGIYLGLSLPILEVEEEGQ